MATTVPRLIKRSMLSFKRMGTLSSFRDKDLLEKRRFEWEVLGVQHSLADDFQYSCMRLDWFRLWGVILGVYCATALFFATLTRLLLMSDHVHFTGEMLPMMSLLEQSFWLSVGHLISVGYGHLQPVSCVAHVLVTAEFFLGILLSALLLGVVVTKASLPSVKVMFSSKCIITKRNGVQHFMFRVANTRGNLLVSPEIRLSCFTHVETEEGESIWAAEPLDVTQPPVLAPAFNLVHKITEASPLWGLTYEELIQRNFSVSLVATDNHTYQTLYATRFYAGETDLLTNVKFADVLKRRESVRIVDLDKFDEVEEYQWRKKAHDDDEETERANGQICAGQDVRN